MMKSLLQYKKTLLAILALMSIFITQSAYADTTVNIGEMFSNSSDTWVAGMKLARGISFIAGIILSCAALFRLKEEASSHNHQRHGVKAPIMLFCVGAFLITLPGTIDTATQTLSLGDNSATELLSRTHTDTGEQQVEDAINGVLLFVKLIGHIAFIRGFFLLKDYGNGKDGTFGRALTHIIGGAMAINIETTVGILAATFLPGLSLTGFSG